MNLKQYYQELNYNIYSQRDSYDIPIRKEYLAKEIGYNKTVLDMGCFDGKISKLIKDNGNIVYGIDINDSFLTIASDKGIITRKHDLEDPLSFENNFFDVVHCGEVIEHIFDTEGLLKEVNRVLKTNGLLFLSTPNFNSLNNRLDVFRGRHIRTLGTYPNDEFGDHIRIFNVPTLNSLLSRTGFHTCSIVGISRDGKLIWLKRRYPNLSDILLFKAKKIKNVI